MPQIAPWRTGYTSCSIDSTFRVGKRKTSPSMLHELRLAFAAKAYDPDRLFLPTAIDAAEFLDWAESLGLVLAGVESFRLFPEGGVQPIQDFSNDAADFSGSSREFFQATRDLIALGGVQGLYFEIVFEDEVRDTKLPMAKSRTHP